MTFLRQPIDLRPLFPELFQKSFDLTQICGNRDHGGVCTLPKNHKSKHIALDDAGKLICKWGK